MTLYRRCICTEVLGCSLAMAIFRFVLMWSYEASM